MTKSIFLRIVFLNPLATWSLQALLQSEKHSVLILSRMRSGSSTTLAMMYAQEENQEGGDVFSLFEPCHHGDRYNPQLTKLAPQDGVGCPYLISSLSRCDFHEVKDLWGWSSFHTSNGHMPFSKNRAETMCKKAKTVAMKVVLPLPLENVTWILQDNPHLKIVDVVRDPRAIYASTQRGANQKHHDPARMHKDCEVLAKNIEVEHPRIHRVVFEELVKNPLKVTQDVYKFLGRRFTSKEEGWVHATFDADCTDVNSTAFAKEGRYHDCHSDSGKAATKWKQELSHHDKLVFQKNEDCVRVAKKYHWD